jgi:toxin ParE1/3/4
MRYRLSPLAERDLIELWAYVAAESGEGRADHVVEAIVDALDMLARYPRAGRLRRELGLAVRSFPVVGHVIYYRPSDVLLVARILPGRRDLEAAWDGG